MSSASSMLNDMLFKSKRLENEIQKLERRLKRVEREENPLGIFEPDISILMSGAIVNCKFANMIDENEPNKNFQNDGRADFNLNDDFKRRFCLLKFERPVSNVHGMSLRFIKNPIMRFTVVDGGGIEATTMRVQAELVSRNWNPSDVTWNSYSASAGTDAGTLTAYTVNIGFTEQFKNETGTDIEGSVFSRDIDQRILSGRLQTLIGGGSFNGIEVKLNHRAPSEPAGLGNFNGELEIGIKDPLESLSSFVITL